MATVDNKIFQATRVPSLLAALSVFAVALFPLVLPAADLTDKTLFSKLKGRVIRSMAVAPFDPDFILIGNKGPMAGDGVIFVSRDGGVSWRYLNSNRALSSAATDVQSVVVVDSKTMLAGTWKNGLYRSADGGRNFESVRGFPVRDIRSLAVSTSNPKTVFAATGGSGVFISTDAGQTWAATSLDAGFIWSVRAPLQSTLVLAGSQNSGLHVSPDNGVSWSRHLKDTKVYEADVSTTASSMMAVAAEDGLYLSADWQNPEAWVKPPALQGKRLSSVRFSAQDSDILLAGDWSGGIWEYSISRKKAVHHYKTLPIVHLESTRKSVFAGSWGNGLYVLPQDKSAYLIDATKAGATAVVERLLNSGVEPDGTDAYHNTALIFASRDGNSAIVQLLLGNSANVNWIDGEGVTPLILAAHKNHPEIAKTLLANGADPATVDGFGRTAIDYARRRGEADPVLAMLRNAAR